MSNAGLLSKRCAIYTRKSSEEGLDQEFNSLHAQREAAEAYIRSQKHEGWRVLPTVYDDGGLSGGTMERPALKRLLEDIQAGRIDVVVVYKVDRLTRALADFAYIVKLFDDNQVSFVSVTQPFNTTSSMGRLTLNVLLSFAQFEREVTGERIRDKIAASKAKGMWMGGNVLFGYQVVDRKLIPKEDEVPIVREIFARYLHLGCVRLLHAELITRGVRSRKSAIISRGALYTMLSNPTYIGKVRHKEALHEGEHEPIVDIEVWEVVQKHLHGAGSEKRRRVTVYNALRGKLFDERGEPIIPISAMKKGKRYRYYVSQHMAGGPKIEGRTSWRLPGDSIDGEILHAMRSMLEDHTLLAETLRNNDPELGQLPRLMAYAKTCSVALDMAAERVAVVETILNRVEIAEGSLTLEIKLEAGLGGGGESAAQDGLRMQRSIPMQMRRCGKEVRIILQGQTSKKVDRALIKAIARAHAWFDLLLSGEVRSIVELATKAEVSERYICRILPLAFLAPSLVEEIVAGEIVSLNTHRLTREGEVAMAWEDQRVTWASS